MKRTITLSEYSRRSLHKNIDSLTKKCKKLGAPVPTFKIGETYQKHIDTGVVTIDSCPHTEMASFDVFDVEIEYEPIKLADWEAIAIVRHDEGQWLQFDIQADYPYNFEESLKNRTCEHCGHQRLTKSFVLRKGNEFKKVGSTCIKDFTGVNPSKFFNLFRTIQTFCSDDEFDFSRGGGRQQPRNYTVREVDDVLNIASHVLDVDKKYIKVLYDEVLDWKRHADKVRSNLGEATSDKVHQVLRTLSAIKYYELHPEETMPDWRKEDIEKFRTSPYFKADYNSTFATEVRNWLTTMEPRKRTQKMYVGDEDEYQDKYENVEVENEMDVKMKAFAEQKRIMEWEVGFVSYIAWAYKESMVPKAQAGHYFEDGQKVELKIKKVRGFNFDSQFGTTYVEIYTTDDNKEVKYMGANPPEISKDNFVSVKATIKHDNYQGIAETKLQRIKIAK